MQTPQSDLATLGGDTTPQLTIQHWMPISNDGDNNADDDDEKR